PAPARRVARTARTLLPALTPSFASRFGSLSLSCRTGRPGLRRPCGGSGLERGVAVTAPGLPVAAPAPGAPQAAERWVLWSPRRWGRFVRVGRGAWVPAAHAGFAPRARRDLSPAGCHSRSSPPVARGGPRPLRGRRPA